MSCIYRNLLFRNKNLLYLTKQQTKLFSSIQCDKYKCRRSLHPNYVNTVRHYAGAYEGDGKTTATILNQDLEMGLMINSYSQFGFRLNNGLSVIGPMVIFPKSVLSWNISNYNDITEESLRLFMMLEPKLDVLVIGIGDQAVTPQFSIKLIEFMKKFKINVEVLKTETACTTFNFLNAENRLVAAAMIPPHHISINEDDLMRVQARVNPNFVVDDKV